MRATRHHRAGFTLVEVLLALLVLCVGMLGTAAILLESLRASRSGIARTQAVTLAADLADLEGQFQRLVADAGARRRLVLRTRGFARSLPTPEVAAARLLGIFSGDRGTSPQAGDSVSAPSRGAFGP